MRKPEQNRLNAPSLSGTLRICAVLAFAMCVPQISLAQYTISTVAGGGPNNLTAAQASLGYPASVALDAAENLYIANSYYEGQILEVSTGGVVTVVAGNGTSGYSGDGGPATSAALAQPDGVFVDDSGNIFIADTGNCVIREVSGGTISTVAGSDPRQCGFGGDGGSPTNAQLDEPTAVFVDGQGNLYIADADNSVIRVVNNGSSAITIGTVTIQPGTIQTVAGRPGNTCAAYPCGDGGAASSALLDLPFGVFVDAAGNIYIADTYDSVIRVVNPGTQPVTIADTTIAGGAIEAVAGTYYDASDGSACQSGNGTATSAFLCLPFGVSVDGSGNIFVADYGNSVIREVVAAGTISTVAGTASTFCSSYLPPAAACGNGGSATGAFLNYPSGVTVDGSDNIYIADTDDNAVREVVQASQDIQAFVGNGFLSYSGDGGAATNAELGYPGGTFVDASGNVYIADSVNSAIRVLNTGSSTITINNVSIAAGDIGTVAGNGVSCAVPTPGGCGDGGPATSAQLNFPAGIFLDGAGNIYIADTGLPETENSVIRVVNPSSSTVIIAGVSIPANSIATVAGILGSICANPAPGGCGDGGTATSAQLTNPNAVVVDGSGNIYIADTEDQAIRVVNTGSSTLMIGTVSIPGGSDNIATVAGTLGTDCTGGALPCGDGGSAPGAYLKFPNGVALDSAGNIYIADTDDEAVRVVNPGTQSVTIAGTTIGAGDLLTVAGTLGQRGYFGDGGAPSSALLDSPWGVLVDSSGNIFIADADNGAIREAVAATTTIQTIAGNGTNGFIGDGGAATSAELNTPQSVALATNNTLFVADTENSRIRELAPSPLMVSVMPTSATVVVGSLQQFNYVANETSSNQSVIWSVNNVAGGNSTVGTIDSAGLYTAPGAVPSPAAVTITATLQVNGNIASASAQATIANPSGTITVTVSTSPSITQVYTCTAQPCTPQPFIASVTGTSNTSVTWYVEGAQGGDATYGTIDSSGNYTGPSAVPTQATIAVEAVSQADATAIGIEQVTIVAAPSAPQPPPQTISPGGTATYSFSLNKNTGIIGQAITLSCLQSSLPSGATCTFTPPTITPTRSSTVPFTVIVSVPSSSAALTKPSPARRWAAPQLFAAFLPLAGILLLGGKAGRRRWRRMGLALAGICLLSLIACGGGSSSTATGSTTYTIAIQGTTTVQPNAVTITTASLTVE